MRPPNNDHENEKLEGLREAMYSRTLSEELTPRERRTLDLKHPTVGEDWQRPEAQLAPSRVAPRSLGIMRVALWGMLTLAIMFFLGAAGFFAYYFTLGGGAVSASPGNVDIVISGPSQIAGGVPAEFQMIVTNRNSVPLELVDIVITYPQGTRSPVDFATELPTQRISLGTINPGGKRQGTVSAVLSGQDGDHAVIKVEVEYRVADSNAVFIASSEYGFDFSSSPLTVSVAGKAQAISGQPVTLTLTVTGNGTAPVRDVILEATYPFGFTFTDADPKPTQSGVWELGDMSPGEKKTITVRGKISGGTGDTRVFHFVTGTRSDKTHKKVDNRFAETTFRADISQPFLNIGVLVNDSSQSGVVVSPGSKVNVAVAWQNNLDTPITNAIIVARLSGVLLDGSTVQTTDGFFRSADDSVFWDKTTTKGVFETIAPGAKGVVSFTFQMPSGDALKNITNPHLDITVNAAGNRIAESGVPESLQATARSSISLASDLQLIAQGLYYTNPFGSTGPMPPKAGTETAYALVFTVRNTTNKITNAKLTASLPPYVRWLGTYSPSSEKISFNQSDGTVTWDLGDIEPNVGLNDTPPRQAAIAVGFTPSTSQIGQQPTLLQNIVLKGIDASSPTPVTRTVDDISTNLAKVSKSSPDISVGGEAGFSASSATVVK